jgi:3-oxoacyl-[acyl-carrier protein] reductase
MDLGLTDRVYVLTGASRGLGRATAEALVADGARVVVSARHQDSLDDVVEALGGPERATAVTADLSDPATPDRLVTTARERYGRLDGALVSVGGPPPGGVLDTTDEQWSRSFEAIFLGAVRMARTVAGALGEGGALALVLSGSVKQPLDNLAISNGLRPGLGMLVKTLADEVGPHGIRVNALMPGWIDTERVRELHGSKDDPEAARRTTAAGIPLRRLGRAEEFGRTAAFLLSPAASYLSGAMIPVDGGAQRPL